MKIECKGSVAKRNRKNLETLLSLFASYDYLIDTPVELSINDLEILSKLLLKNKFGIQLEFLLLRKKTQ